MKAIKGRINRFTPKGARYACVGIYKFKGVKEPQIVYTVGTTIESLQPPKGSEKVKRLGGPKKIKSQMKDKELKEWLWYLLTRTALIMVLYELTILGPIIIDPTLRKLNNLDGWFWWLDHLTTFIEMLMSAL